MANIVRHYVDFLDGLGYQEIKPPQEWKQLGIELNFVQDSERLSTNAFTWEGDSAEDINTYIDAGLTGGYGLFEGLPYKAVLDCNGTFYDIVVACLDFASADALFKCDRVDAPIRETGKIDFLNDRASSIRFEFLASLPALAPGRISASDYIDIYYVIGKYPETIEIITTGLGVYMISKEIYETIKRLLDIAAAILGGVTGFAESGLQFTALVIYTVLLLISLTLLAQRFIDYLFPFVYYHRGMYVKTLIQKACDYLGLGFSSSIFTSSSGDGYYQYIMPPKNDEGKKLGTSSTETGYYDGTFQQLLLDLIEEYNGEIKIIGNTLRFERKGSFSSTSSFTIPEVKGMEPYSTNASEVSANYVIEYQFDDIDLHDYDFSIARLLTATCEPLTVSNKKNVLLKGLTTRSIPFTLPHVKTSTTAFELIMQSFFNTISGLISAISTITLGAVPAPPTIPPGSNINVLRLDTHFTSLHKTGIYSGSGKTNPLTINIIGAYNLMKKYHYSEIIKPIFAGGNGNQWKRYKGRIPLCCEDYLAIKDNNYATYKGNLARFISIKWNPYDQIADIEFEVNEKYTNNLQVRITQPYASVIIL